MSIKTVPKPPYSPDLATCDFWLFPKLRGCRYERIEEMKETVKKVMDTLTQEDFHGAFQKLLERYNKCIAARGDFEGDLSFMCVLSIKVPIQKKKKSGNLSYAHRILLSTIFFQHSKTYTYASIISAEIFGLQAKMRLVGGLVGWYFWHINPCCLF